jgi:glycosyltransferase involved in cell wall biosynthesis
VIDTYSSDMAQCIRRAINAKQYDVIVASQLGTAAYSSLFNGTPALLDEIELGIYHQQVQALAPPHVHLRHRLMWAKQSAYIRSLLPRFQACTVVSEQEKRLLASVAPRYQAVELIPNCIDLPKYDRESIPRACHTLIFTGAFTYRVNYDAMVWFLAEIYPLIRQRIPSVRLVITGDHANLPLPPAENVTLTGYIDDVRPAVAGATVSLVPIHHGGGTRLKLLEAMALGTTVVSTTKGAEGLDVQHGRHLLLADTPQAFADAVIRLLQGPDLRQRLAANAFRLVQASYNWEIVMPRFLKLVDRLAAPA